MKMKRKRSNITQQGDAGKTIGDRKPVTALQNVEIPIMIGNQNVMLNTRIMV